jgi:hypothetical protein
MLKICLLLFGVLILQPFSLPAAAQPAPAVNAGDEKAALDQFNASVERYMALRRKVLTETSGPSKNSTSVQLTDASDALAAAIQRSRRDAAMGDVFVAPAAEVMKRRVLVVVRNEHLAPVLADIDDDGPIIRQPKIHLRFPAAAQVATMPPAILAVLPPLPKGLEYRIVGRYLVLRDVDAALVLDYIADAIPR